MRFYSFRVLIICLLVCICSEQGNCLTPAHGGPKKSRSYFGISGGINYYFGDLKNNNIRVPLHYRYGIRVSAEREIYRATRLCINFFHGNLIGDELRVKSNLNFKTSVFAPQVCVSLNLLGLGNSPASEYLSLYASAGLEGIFFSTSGDLRSDSGQKYYYWSDGTIRDMPENPANLGLATEIGRDYVFETDYRNLDIDNIGRYPRFSIGIPLGIAMEGSLKMGLSLRVGAVYHLTFTDFLDNITAQSIGTREGNPKNDKFLNIYAGIFYRLPILQARRTGIKTCGYKSRNYGNKRKINRVN